MRINYNHFSSKLALWALLLSFAHYVLGKSIGLSAEVPIPILLLYIIMFLSSYRTLRFRLCNEISTFLFVMVAVLGLLGSLLFRGTIAHANLYLYMFFLLPILIAPGISLTKFDIKIIRYYSLGMLFYFLLFVNLNSINSNNVGIVVVICSVFMLLTASLKQKLSLIYLGIIILFSVPALIFSDSRTSLGTFFLFIIGKFFLPKSLRKKVFFNLAFLLLTFGSLLYMHLYVYMYLTDFNLAEYIGFMSDNKTAFSGRQFIWMEAFVILENHPFGIGSNFSLDSYVSNELHNSVLQLFVYYGVIVAPSLLILLFGVWRKLVKFIHDDIVKDCMVAFLAFCFMSLTEIVLVGFPICLLTLFIGFSRVNVLKSINARPIANIR